MVIPPDPDIIIDDAKVVLSSTSFVYNGKICKPVIKTITGYKIMLATNKQFTKNKK